MKVEMLDSINFEIVNQNKTLLLLKGQFINLRTIKGLISKCSISTKFTTIRLL